MILEHYAFAVVELILEVCLTLVEVDSFVVSTCVELLCFDVEGEGFTSVSWDCDVLFSFEVDSDDAFLVKMYYFRLKQVQV